MEFTGQVIHGKQIARKLGFPTANIHLHTTINEGVYFGYTQSLPSIIYITDKLLEAHIYNWSGDLYNQIITVKVIHKLRGCIKFNCYDNIITQINKDLVLCKLFSQDIETNGKCCVAFSGGKEACILIDLLHKKNVLEFFDIIHFKPKDKNVLPDISRFLHLYNKTYKVIEYTVMESVMNEIDEIYTHCYIGVRRSDTPEKFNENGYKTKWLKKCKLVTPLLDFSYTDVWNYIDYFNVDVSPLYSQGYTSVGYNSKPNMVLTLFDGKGYKHAKDLDNIDLERKNY